MASKKLTIISSILLLLLISLAEADLLGSPSPATNKDFGSCPRDPLQLGVCTNVLGLSNVIAGDTRARPCCSAINGLADVQVADCLCYIFIKTVPVVYEVDKAVREIFYACNRVFPIGFQCPPPTVLVP